MIVYIILTLVSFFTNLEWTTSLSVLTHADWGYQSIATLKEFMTLPMIWTGTSLGGVNITTSFYPFQLIYAVLANAHLSYGLSERIVFMWPILILCPIASYILIKKNLSSNLAALIGSFVYTYNTYFSLIKTGHLTLMVAYSLSPLVIYFFQRSLERRKIYLSLIAGLLAFVVGYYEFRGFYILCLILFLYYIYYTFIIERVRKFREFIIASFFAGVPIIAAFLLNFYWILGLAKVGAIISNSFFERTLFGNEFLNINSAITLFHPFWTGGRPTEFIVQPIPYYLWLVPVFAFLGLYFNRKNKNVLFFGIIALIGIFLTKQVAQPFGAVYPFLYKHFPGFNAFREASKFYFLIALGYSVLIAGFVDWLWNNWTKKGIKTYAKYFITALITFIFIWNTKPLITGEIGSLFVARHVPSDYVRLKDFILNHDDYFRTLWIPTASRFGIYTNNHPVINTVDMINSDWSSYIKNKRTEKISEGELMKDVLTLPFSNNLLDLTSVKYVIVPLEDKANDDNFFVYYFRPRKYYIDELDKIKYLHKINIGTSELAVYENTHFRPHIYTTSQKETIKKNVDFKAVSFRFINPSEYRIKLTGVKNPLYVNFSESYHPQWKVRAGEFNWFAALHKKKYFVSDKDHLKNDAGLNSYYFDPRAVCQNYKCTQNADGSYDIDITLYFQPQSYVYFGSIISLLTLVAILGYLIVILIKRR